MKLGLRHKPGLGSAVQWPATSGLATLCTRILVINNKKILIPFVINYRVNYHYYGIDFNPGLRIQTALRYFCVAKLLGGSTRVVLRYACSRSKPT